MLWTKGRQVYITSHPEIGASHLPVVQPGGIDRSTGGRSKGKGRNASVCMSSPQHVSYFIHMQAADLKTPLPFHLGSRVPDVAS